ncbi:MAG: hypothetical protein ACC726_00940 [Chloroflexota bacterium]
MRTAPPPPVAGRLVVSASAATPKTKLVSQSSGGDQGESSSSSPDVSATGRYAAFRSTATDLISGGTSGESQIFVRDRVKDKTEAISRSSGGSQGNDRSTRSSISADGRWVAFQSDADNLVAKDTNGKAQIILFDRITTRSAWSGATTVVPRANGAAADVFRRGPIY